MSSLSGASDEAIHPFPPPCLSGCHAFSVMTDCLPALVVTRYSYSFSYFYTACTARRISHSSPAFGQVRLPMHRAPTESIHPSIHHLLLPNHLYPGSIQSIPPPQRLCDINPFRIIKPYRVKTVTLFAPVTPSSIITTTKQIGRDLYSVSRLPRSFINQPLPWIVRVPPRLVDRDSVRCPRPCHSRHDHPLPCQRLVAPFRLAAQRG